MSILKRTPADEAIAGNHVTTRRRFRRRVVVAMFIGIGVSLLIVVIQARSASIRRGTGLAAFGGSIDGGSWTPVDSHHGWSWIRARSARGEWVGGVRDDATARSDMWSARDLAIARLRGEDTLPRPLPRGVAGWMSSDLLIKRPWAAGFERLSIGWPLSSFRSTCVWGNREEMDRVGRMEVLEGWDAFSGEHEWLASLLGVNGTSPPESAVPTAPLWPGLIGNGLIWSAAAFGVTSVPWALRRARGAWWHLQGRCRACGYPVGDYRDGRCPECGAVAVAMAAMRQPDGGT